MTDSSFMLEALELAKKGQFTVQNGVCVGCIISKNNEILGQGWYEYYGAPHAEIRAIESIKEKYKENFEEVLSGSTLTVTLEPCRPSEKLLRVWMKYLNIISKRSSLEPWIHLNLVSKS